MHFEEEKWTNITNITIIRLKSVNLKGNWYNNNYHIK